MLNRTNVLWKDWNEFSGKIIVRVSLNRSYKFWVIWYKVEKNCMRHEISLTHRIGLEIFEKKSYSTEFHLSTVEIENK